MTDQDKSSVSGLIKQAASHDKPTGEKNTDVGLSLEDHKEKHDIELLRQQFNEAVDTHKMRIGYANRIFWLVCIWLICVIASLVLSGFKIEDFVLSDKVLMTFIATTTLSVLGLFAIVAKWLFPQNKQNTRNKDS